jgi:hypothetical protein
MQALFVFFAAAITCLPGIQHLHGFIFCPPTTLCSLYYFRRKPLLAPAVGLAPTLSGLEPPVLLLH